MDLSFLNPITGESQSDEEDQTPLIPCKRKIQSIHSSGVTFPSADTALLADVGPYKKQNTPINIEQMAHEWGVTADTTKAYLKQC